MAATINQGKTLPETDSDRALSEWDLFRVQCLGELQRALQDAVTHRRTGYVRLNVRLAEGKIITQQALTDFVKDIDRG